MLRPKVVVVGLGPAGADLMAEGARRRLQGADAAFLRTSIHPAAAGTPGIPSFDGLYESAQSFEDVYVGIVDALVRAAVEHGEVVYAVPGSPLIAERSVELLRQRGEIELEIIPALSFVDLAWSAVGIDPVDEGARLVDAHQIGTRLRGPGPLLVVQCHSAEVLAELKLSIDADLLDPRPRPIVLHHLGLDDAQVVELDVDELDRFEGADHLTSVFFPALRSVGPAAEDLVDLMAALRGRCPWDQKQTHGSLARHLLEESYESLEAIEHLASLLDEEAGHTELLDEAYAHVQEELGDLAFQVVFHAHLAQEAGRFNLADVFDGVRTKLIGRHPHVFGDASVSSADEVAVRWEEIKRAEKGRSSITEGIPAALPALSRYVKLRRKAAAVGLPAPEIERAVAALRSLASSTDPAGFVAGGDASSSASASAATRVGELLAAVADLAAAAGIDAEASLRARSDELRATIVELESGDPALG